MSPPHRAILWAKCSLVKLLSCIGYAQSHFIRYFISSRWRHQMHSSSKWKRQRTVIYITKARIGSSSREARRLPQSSHFIGPHLALKFDIWKKLKWIRSITYSVPCAKKGVYRYEFERTNWKNTQLSTFLIQKYSFFPPLFSQFRNSCCFLILPTYLHIFFYIYVPVYIYVMQDILGVLLKYRRIRLSFSEQ